MERPRGWPHRQSDPERETAAVPSGGQTPYGRDHAAAPRGVGGYAPWLALAALIAGAGLPQNGPGIPLCWIKHWTGFPCPSCGLTRSFLHTLHGDWWAAIQLHPLGPPLVAWCALVAAAPLMPASVRRRGADLLENPALGLRRILPAVIALLILNGLYRIWWIVWLKRPSPW